MMTEKRFIIVWTDNNQSFHYEDKGDRLESEDVPTVLNMLHEENQQLRKDAKYWRKSSAYWSRQESENDIENDKLREENEQLKQQLKEILSRKDGLEWLRNNTVWEQMPTDIRTFTKTSYEK